jgi:hypothetical protein
MALKTVKAARRTQGPVAAKSERHQTPQSFEEALKQGWTIHEQLSSWHFKTANKRDGFLFLTREGSGKNSKTLIVPFVALYELRKPYFLDSVEI